MKAIEALGGGQVRGVAQTWMPPRAHPVIRGTQVIREKTVVDRTAPDSAKVDFSAARLQARRHRMPQEPRADIEADCSIP